MHFFLFVPLRLVYIEYINPSLPLEEKPMKNFIIMLSVSLLLAACASEPQTKAESADAKPAEQSAGVSQGADMTAPAGSAVSSGALTESARVAEQKGLQDKSIYFDLDRFVVKPEYRDLLRQHADILQAHPGDSVTLEGNADERGSPEYNLALGGKRARTVKSQLILLGIAGARVQEVSFGEERPRASCHEEKCWQQNRRVDFAYRSNP
jgi:peptidoglycan-associated lipoprotein